MLQHRTDYLLLIIGFNRLVLSRKKPIIKTVPLTDATAPVPSKPAAMLLNSPSTHTLVQSSGWGDPHDRVCGLPRKWAATARRRRGAYGRKGSPSRRRKSGEFSTLPGPVPGESRSAASLRSSVTSAGFSAPAVAQTTVPGAPIPASFTQAPAAHDGSSTFKLALEFSHESKRFQLPLGARFAVRRRGRAYWRHRKVCTQDYGKDEKRLSRISALIF